VLRTGFIILVDFQLSHLATFGDFCTRTTGSHVALRTRNSDTKSSRELFSVSKDAASLLVCARKKFLVLCFGYFVSDIISGGLLGHLGPLHLALGPNR